MYPTALPLPAYSLTDLFNDLRNGVKKSFYYDDVQFFVTVSLFRFTVTDGNFTAVCPYCGCMLDLQSMAACLLEYKRNLNFDRNGNILN